MARTIPQMPYLVLRAADGLPEDHVARFRHIQDATDYCDWRASQHPPQVWRVRYGNRPGTAYSAGQQ